MSWFQYFQFYCLSVHFCISGQLVGTEAAVVSERPEHCRNLGEILQLLEFLSTFCCFKKKENKKSCCWQKQTKLAATIPHRTVNLRGTQDYNLCGLSTQSLFSGLPLVHQTAVPTSAHSCRYILRTCPNRLCQVQGWKQFEILAGQI